MKKSLIIAAILLFIFLVYYFAFYATEKSANSNAEQTKPTGDLPLNRGTTISAPAPPPSLQAEIDRRINDYKTNKKAIASSYHVIYTRRGGKLNFNDYLKELVLSELVADANFAAEAREYLDMLNIYKISVTKKYGLTQQV